MGPKNVIIDLRLNNGGDFFNAIPTGGKTMTVKKVATVIGVGPGLGAALAHRFAADYAVALVARARR